MTGKLLIAGVGNIFLGDDGFGVEVANRLAAPNCPTGPGSRLRNQGHASGLRPGRGYSSAILIDASARGGAPGTIYVIEPDLASEPDATDGDDAALAAQPAVQRARHAAGRRLQHARHARADWTRQVLVVGCEPASVDYGIGLSEPVAGRGRRGGHGWCWISSQPPLQSGDDHQLAHEGVGPCASGFPVR